MVRPKARRSRHRTTRHDGRVRAPLPMVESAPLSRQGAGQTVSARRPNRPKRGQSSAKATIGARFSRAKSCAPAKFTA